jgi:hypothetical protein
MDDKALRPDAIIEEVGSDPLPVSGPRPLNFGARAGQSDGLFIA